MDLKEIAANIQPDQDEIWVSRTKYSISYPDHGNEICFEIEDNSFWFKHRNRCVVEAMKRLPPGGLFLDIGGGNGYVSLAIQNAGWPVVLIEPGARGVRNARSRGIEKVICSTFENAGFLDGSIAAAGAFDVVEHIKDDCGFVRSVARSLAPGGRLYLTVPAFSGLWSQEDDDAGHYRRYTAATLRGVIEQAGLHVEYLTYFFRLLPVPILLLRTIPHKLGILRSQSQLVKRACAEHRAPGGPFKSFFDSLLDRELALICSGCTMAFGGSCLSVARKL